MKKIKLFLAFAIMTNFGFTQLSQYQSYLDPFLTAPMESGYFILKTPNVFTPGSLFQAYKAIAPDANNSMVLLDVHTDELSKMTHYKYQQTYKGVPIEGAGCIEHVDKNGMMIFINAKLTNLDLKHTPLVKSSDAIRDLLIKLKADKVKGLWDDPAFEQQLRIDMEDSSATYYPTTELLFALDNMKDVQYIIDSTRYKLAYKIKIHTVNDIINYYVDANTGGVFRIESQKHNDGPAGVYGYGSKIIDTRWEGGFTQKWTLHSNDAGRRIHTKQFSNGNWNNNPNVKDADDNWGNTYLTETSTHYNVMMAWDYYYNYFNRIGMNNDAIEVRVMTQLPEQNAYFYPSAIPSLSFGQNINSADYGMEPSVVAHEFTHGVINYTSNLGNTFETGAIAESYGDIFGVVIQAMMHDGGSTDWIQGNHISSPLDWTRSLKNPNSRGTHWDGANLVLGQGDTYNGTDWYSGDGSVDAGGVHINCGVHNYWFYLLSDGGSGTNDLADAYNIQGIGMTKATKIAYFALHSILMSASQFSDSRQATIEAAKILYGECSVEHQNTIDAWYAVGMGDLNTCTFTLSTDEITDAEDVRVYPNPTSTSLTIEVPYNTNKEIKIYDVTGKLVESIINDKLLTHCDISSFDDGMYTILFNLNGTVITKKFIVQK